MDLNLVHTFKLKAFKKEKAIKSSCKKSRRCLATIVKDNNEFKAAVKLNPSNPESNELIIIPLTKESLDLKDKLYVFTIKPDIHNRPACVIRTPLQANIAPGLDTQYTSVKENCVISGYIIVKDGVKYFEYEQLVAFNPKGAFINPVKIDVSKPLFNK